MFKRIALASIALSVRVQHLTTVRTQAQEVYLGDAHVDGGQDHVTAFTSVSTMAASAPSSCGSKAARCSSRKSSCAFMTARTKNSSFATAFPPVVRLARSIFSGNRRVIESVELWYGKARWGAPPQGSALRHPITSAQRYVVKHQWAQRCLRYLPMPAAPEAYLWQSLWMASEFRFFTPASESAHSRWRRASKTR